MQNIVFESCVPAINMSYVLTFAHMKTDEGVCMGREREGRRRVLDENNY